MIKTFSGFSDPPPIINDSSLSNKFAAFFKILSTIKINKDFLLADDLRKSLKTGTFRDPETLYSVMSDDSPRLSLSADFNDWEM